MAKEIKPLPVKTEEGGKGKEKEPEVTIKGEDLKLCPKCGEPCTGPYKDHHGLYRCNCSFPKCGYWDSIASYTAQEAADKWQAMKGPENRSNW